MRQRQRLFDGAGLLAADWIGPLKIMAGTEVPRSALSIFLPRIRTVIPAVPTYLGASA